MRDKVLRRRIKGLLEVAGRGLTAEEIVSVLRVSWYDWTYTVPDMVSERVVFNIGGSYFDNPARKDLP